jgi:hypothetical protein
MIKLLWKELEYDIEQQTFRIAGVKLHDNAKVELRDMAQMDKGKSNLDYVMRYCETGVARCRVLLKDKLIDTSTNKGFWTGWGEYNSNEIEGESTTSAYGENGRVDKEGHSYNTEENTDALDRTKESWDFAFGCDTDEKAMAMLLHSFVVRYCLWQWSRAFGFTDVMGSFKDECDDLEESIEDLLNEIVMPKKYHEWHDFKKKPIDEVEVTVETE